METQLYLATGDLLQLCAHAVPAASQAAADWKPPTDVIATVVGVFAPLVDIRIVRIKTKVCISALCVNAGHHTINRRK